MSIARTLLHMHIVAHTHSHYQITTTNTPYSQRESGHVQKQEFKLLILEY